MNFVSNSMIIIMAYYTSITMAKTYIRCSENKAMSCSYNPLEVDQSDRIRYVLQVSSYSSQLTRVGFIVAQ